MNNLDLFDDVEDFDGFSVFDEEELNDSSDESTFVIRGKFILDGAETLEEAADLARAYAEFLDELATKGFELSSCIENDYGFVKLM